MKIERKHHSFVLIFFVTLLAALLTGCAQSGNTSLPETREAVSEPAPSGESAADGAPAAAAPAAAAGAAAHYADSCAGCHGADRRGATGPALLPQRMTQSQEYYFDVIKNGKPGSAMPPWGSTMDDSTIQELLTYIQSEPEDESVEWTEADITASLEVLIPEADLPTQPTHTGNMDNLLLVTEREGRGIAVLDGDTHTLLGKIPASYRAHGYTFSPVEPRWAYNMGRDGWVFKIDLYSLEPVRKIRIGLDARSVAISDDGRYLIAANYVPATAAILDAETLELVKLIETNATNPEGEMVASRVATILDTAPELVGPYFLVALKEAGQVWRIDWSQPDFPIVKLENVGHILHDGFLSPDNQTFYLAAQTDNWMAAIDVDTMTLAAKIETGAIPHPGTGATWEADGKEYGATTHAGEGKVTIWDLDEHGIVATVETPGSGLFIRSHEESPYIWADCMFAEQPNTIVVFEKAPPFKVVGLITEGQRTLHPEFTQDGAYVYVADWDGNLIRVYDAHTLEKVAEIEGITTPTGIFNTHRRSETLGH